MMIRTCHPPHPPEALAATRQTADTERKLHDIGSLCLSLCMRPLPPPLPPCLSPPSAMHLFNYNSCNVSFLHFNRPTPRIDRCWLDKEEIQKKRIQRKLATRAGGGGLADLFYALALPSSISASVWVSAFLVVCFWLPLACLARYLPHLNFRSGGVGKNIIADPTIDDQFVQGNAPIAHRTFPPVAQGSTHTP